MKSIRTLFVVSFMFVLYGNTAAQKGRDKMEALHMAFINKRLELTPAESEKFWPVYNEYNDKVRQVRINLRKSYRSMPEHPDDATAEQYYQISLRSKQAEADLYREYGLKLKQIIGIKKLVNLYKAEEDFKREIIKSLKDRED